MHGGALAIHVDSTLSLWLYRLIKEFALLLYDHVAGVGRFQELEDA
jgi:hypothetical protein